MIDHVDDSLAGVVEPATPDAMRRAAVAEPHEVRLAELRVGYEQVRKDVDRVSGALDRISTLSDRIGGIGERVARMEEGIKHVPTHWQTVGMLTALFLALTVMATVIPSVQRVLGIVPAAQSK